MTVNRAGQTSKTWYLRYYDAKGKQQRSKLGDYPDLSLAKAQAAAEDAKASAKQGVNLAQEKAAQKRVKVDAVQTEQAQQATSFESVAEAWLAKKSMDWEGQHATRQCERLVGNVYPLFAGRGINDITMQDIDGALTP